MTLPNALVIGPMKAGTTWIHEYLSWRGDVCLPHGVKETFFFDRYSGRGTSWYARHFRHYKPGQHVVVVEVAPSLFHAVDAPATVGEKLGAVPLIATVRDPVVRAWSHYLHLRRHGFTRAPLRDALKDFPEIVEASRYDTQIARWRAALPAAPLTILRLEDLIADRNTYIGALCSALGLEPFPAPETLGVSNASGLPRSFVLARAGQSIATAVRSVRGYGLVNIAKFVGLKRLFFGVARQARPDAEDLALLRHILQNPYDRAATWTPDGRLEKPWR